MSHLPKALWQTLNRLFPALAFFGGFIWDAMTLGLSVGVFDLWTLAAYLLGAAGILWWLAFKTHQAQNRPQPLPQMGLEGDPSPATGSLVKDIQQWMMHQSPYFALQFCFGGLFSALFIFYFKSSSHLSAYLVVLFLALLLVANEFLEGHYERFTLTWTLFGICSMLMLNFVIPHILGSLNPFWFYFSTVMGAGGTLCLRHYAPGKPGRATPIVVIAFAWVFSFWFDIIPPVPLVKKQLVVGQKFEHEAGVYRIQIETPPWYAFWRDESAIVHLSAGSRIYCLSSVFAPNGMRTQLYHQWSFKDPKSGWKKISRIGFSVKGGREQGYRGYSYKQSPQPGNWKVEVQSIDGRTVCRHEFQIVERSQLTDDSFQFWEM